MRLGLVTPIVLLNPRVCNTWERDGTPEDLAAIASAADRLGYHHLTASEHVGIPATELERRGGRYWDPAATLAFLAAHTRRIKLATHVLVLGYHHPVEIVKTYGTVDVISGGRLILGVGVGSLREEFDLVGAAFDGRGERADAAMRALRATFGRSDVELDGVRWRVEPAGIQTPPPIWVGGRTVRSLRRAVELGDGWVPFGLSLDELADALATAATWPAWADRAQPLECIFEAPTLLDPLEDPDGVRSALRAVAEAGATIINVRLRHGSRDHCLEQLAALADLGAELDPGRT